MLKSNRCLLLIPLTLISCALLHKPAKPKVIRYPQTPTVEQIDTYHGMTVPDPYRWLEDVDSQQTKNWVAAQNKITFAYLDQIPARNWLRERLTQLWNYERYGIPFYQGGRYFIQKNDGLQNQSVLYTMASLTEEPTLLLDPNQLSQDGTIALADYDISEDGKYMAYALSSGGSDWREVKVREVTTGQDLEDHLQWVKFSNLDWSHDNQGFYYSRYAAPAEDKELQDVNYYQKLYYHKLGTPQSEDTLIYERPDEKEWGFGGGVSEDGKYLLIHIWKGTEEKNRVFYKDLSNAEAPVVELLNDFDAQYQFVGNAGTTFWFQTNLNAPKGRLLAIDINQPERAHWQEVIPESADTLNNINLVGNHFICSYLQDAYTQVQVLTTDGSFVRQVELPGIGTAGGFAGKQNRSETFYSFTSFTTPGTIYRYDVANGESSVFKQPKVAFDPNDFVAKQVFYRSKDGTIIPMFISHRKDIELNGNHHTYLYGYGGFNVSLTPSFSVSNLVWMETGGIYAMANLRGGGEYGEDWHQQGMKLNKQNVFDDFIAAAEWLVDNKYTKPAKLAIGGGSNGGLLVGACLNQRPDLFAAALPAVGVMDMLRFNQFTIGWAWESDYGSPDNLEEFRALYNYSPYHNIQQGIRYPAVLITTADHDDRVVPAHSFKYAAALQAENASLNPTLIRIETRAGHGAGKPTTKIIEEIADRWAFVLKNLNVTM